MGNKGSSWSWAIPMENVKEHSPQKGASAKVHGPSSSDGSAAHSHTREGRDSTGSVKGEKEKLMQQTNLAIKLEARGRNGATEKMATKRRNWHLHRLRLRVVPTVVPRQSCHLVHLRTTKATLKTRRLSTVAQKENDRHKRVKKRSATAALRAGQSEDERPKTAGNPEARRRKTRRERWKQKR